MCALHEPLAVYREGKAWKRATPRKDDSSDSLWPSIHESFTHGEICIKTMQVREGSDWIHQNVTASNIRYCMMYCSEKGKQ